MAKVNTGGGLGNEPWYKSRRLYGAILCGVAAVTAYLGLPWVAEVCVIVAGAFNIRSWTKSK